MKNSIYCDIRHTRGQSHGRKLVLNKLRFQYFRDHREKYWSMFLEVKVQEPEYKYFQIVIRRLVFFLNLNVVGILIVQERKHTTKPGEEVGCKPRWRREIYKVLAFFSKQNSIWVPTEEGTLYKPQEPEEFQGFSFEGAPGSPVFSTRHGVRLQSLRVRHSHQSLAVEGIVAQKHQIFNIFKYMKIFVFPFR